MSKETTQTFRMTMLTYRRIRKSFKAKYNESTADYFKRLADFLEAEK